MDESNTFNEDSIEYLSEKELFSKVVNDIPGEAISVLSDKYNLKDLSRANIAMLTSVDGITKRMAEKIMAMFELSRRLESSACDEKIKLNDANAVYQYAYPKMRGLKREEMHVLLLDTKLNLIRDICMYTGTLSSCVSHPRETYKPAILESASSIIIVHNHPSGNSLPSQEDIGLTRKMKEAGDIIGIPMKDHVVIGDGEFKSINDYL